MRERLKEIQDIRQAERTEFFDKVIHLLIIKYSEYQFYRFTTLKR